MNLGNALQLHQRIDAGDALLSSSIERISSPLPPLIVAVDDEIDDIFFLRSLLKQSGIAHRFQHYSNGDAAVAALSSMLSGERTMSFPLVCLLDLKMTGMTGFDVLKWIRAQKPLDVLPVMMFSSSDDPRDLESAREFGAQSYVKKYPLPSVMKKLVEEAQNFASLETPKKVFLQWHYRFIGTSEPTLPTAV